MLGSTAGVSQAPKRQSLRLESGSKVAVLGGGPAGSFFSYFLLDAAQKAGADIHVDIYESRDFSAPGSAGCNMCGGIISESLVQYLAVDGINLPDTVVQRGIDSYVLHTDEGSVEIMTPLHEKRIAVVHRGGGPRGIKEQKWWSFDAYLLELAQSRGAQVVRARVDRVGWENGRPQISTKGGAPMTYDLLVPAIGVNSPTLKLFEELGVGYQAPRTAKTYVRELFLGQETLDRYLGSSLHLFLLNLPGLEFGAIIPKGDYATICLLGEGIDTSLIRSFMSTPEVTMCLPPNWQATEDFCHCSPRINVQAAVQPFADRMVFVGDCAVTKLYKDGIGAAYRTAKAAALTAFFDGISAEAFRRHYWPACAAIENDNAYGKTIFGITRQIQKIATARKGILSTTAAEQSREARLRRMSLVLWDLFTGSAPYRDVFVRTLHPSLQGHLARNIATSVWRPPATRAPRSLASQAPDPDTGALGRVYRDNEVIARQGEAGTCMFVIQSGQVEVLREDGDRKARLAVLGAGEIVGEMALVDSRGRSATLRSMGEARVLTVDKKTFLHRVHEDPSLAYRILQQMSRRIRDLDAEVARARDGA